MVTDHQTLRNQQSGVSYRANPDTGFYQVIDAKGQWGEERLSPGFTVGAGWQNFIRVFTDEGIQKPFLAIFGWTMIFSLLTVVLTVAVGMVLACLVQWEALKGKAVYRVMLILPYAVPAFISILIFKGLFNQSFGEINVMLNALFGSKPAWFSDPTLARAMLIIVNTWLGYPYMMILCMGLLKAIPEDLYEASAMDGAGPLQNFFLITVPLLLKPLTPLMIASFAFNFNNFVLVQLLTNGAPDRLGTTTPAGYTDLLVNYTWRIAFEGGGGQDFGLAAAIAYADFPAGWRTGGDQSESRADEIRLRSHDGDGTTQIAEVTSVYDASAAAGVYCGNTVPLTDGGGDFAARGKFCHRQYYSGTYLLGTLAAGAGLQRSAC